MLWFHNLSLKWKFVAPSLLIVIIFSCLSGLVIKVFSEQARIDKVLNQKLEPVQENIAEGYRDLYQMITAGQGVLLSRDNSEQLAQYIALYHDDESKALGRLTSASVLLDGGVIAGQHQAILEDIRLSYRRWVEHYAYIVANPNVADMYFVNNKARIDHDFSALTSAIVEIRQVLADKEIALQAEISKQVSVVTIILEVGVLLVAIVSFVLAWLLADVILRPLIHLSNSMEELSKGEGDLTQRIEISVNDEVGQLGKSFNGFVSTIHRTILEVGTTLESVVIATKRIEAESQEVVAKVVSQQEESALAATAVHEMSVTSDNVSSHANAAAEASQSASAESSQAKHQLKEAVSSMSKLAQDIDASSRVIGDLERDVDNIASILDVIRGIADQTNLLALNAAIEAARAGEQGRGFAVVADEVRSLASKTQASTGEIQAMIERLQNGSREAVQAMASSRDSGGHTVVQADTANGSLDAISEAIAVINDMNVQIATAATQQSQVSDEINQNVQHIANNSEQVAGQISQMGTAFSTLTGQCQQLQYQLGRFKV